MSRGSSWRRSVLELFLSYAILAEYFPKELAGRANAALNLFHIGGAFVVQYMTGVSGSALGSRQMGTILRSLTRPRLLSTSAFRSRLGYGVPRTWVLTRLQRVCSRMRRAACCRNSSSLSSNGVPAEGWRHVFERGLL